MAENVYTINYTDTTLDPILVGENTVDATTVLELIGHGYPAYGEPQNRNFLHLLENFASTEAPNPATLGQIWFKKVTDDHGNIIEGKFDLNVCSYVSDSGIATWSKMSQVVTDGSGTNYNTGDLFYDAANKKLKVWDSSLGTGGDWNTIGPTDIVHTKKVFDSILVTPNSSSASYTSFDMDNIEKDIQDTGGNIPNVTGNGSLNLVKMTIMAKEFKNGEGMPYNNAKSCVWLYKFVIRSVKLSDNSHKLGIVGAPSYELIAQNPEDLDWDVNVSLDNSTQQLIVNIALNTPSQNYITIGFDSEITRI